LPSPQRSKPNPDETPEEKLRRLLKEVRHYKKYLVDLVEANRDFLIKLDKVYEHGHAPTYDRGREAGKLARDLQYQFDLARHFGLNLELTPLKEMKSLKKSKGV
jgi:hypothetical protein